MICRPRVFHRTRELIIGLSIFFTLPICSQVAASAEHNENLSITEAVSVVEKWQDAVDKLHGYSCLLVYREQRNEKQSNLSFLTLRVSHEPLDVRAVVVWPPDERGVTYHFDGKRTQYSRPPTPSEIERLERNRTVVPQSLPIQIDRCHLESLVRRCRAIINDSKPTAVNVTTFDNAAINKDVVSCMEITFVDRHDHPDFSRIRIFYNSSTFVPIRCETYGWPEVRLQDLPLIEELTFLNFEKHERK